jgi:cell division septation protein DedD
VTDEKDGPVHYQVSVTGRQAAAFFLVLLAALGLSFFFGMRTGAEARRGKDPVSALAAQSDIRVPEADEGEGGEKATPVPTEVPIGFEAAAPEPARVVEKPAPPVEEPKPASAAPVPEPTPRRTEPPAPAPAKEPVAKAEEGPFWVQILVTKSAEKADALAKKLKADGFRPDVSLVPGKTGLFRVRVGSFPDRAKAEAAAKKVEKVKKLQTKPIVVPGK